MAKTPSGNASSKSSFKSVTSQLVEFVRCTMLASSYVKRNNQIFVAPRTPFQRDSCEVRVLRRLVLRFSPEGLAVTELNEGVLGWKLRTVIVQGGEEYPA